MDTTWLATRRRLQSIGQEYRLILQELRQTPLADYQRWAQLSIWAADVWISTWLCFGNGTAARAPLTRLRTPIETTLATIPQPARASRGITA